MEQSPKSTSRKSRDIIDVKFCEGAICEEVEDNGGTRLHVEVYVDVVRKADSVLLERRGLCLDDFNNELTETKDGLSLMSWLTKEMLVPSV